MVVRDGDDPEHAHEAPREQQADEATRQLQRETDENVGLVSSQGDRPCAQPLEVLLARTRRTRAAERQTRRDAERPLLARETEDPERGQHDGDLRRGRGRAAAPVDSVST